MLTVIEGKTRHAQDFTSDSPGIGVATVAMRFFYRFHVRGQRTKITCLAVRMGPSSRGIAHYIPKAFEVLSVILRQLYHRPLSVGLARYCYSQERACWIDLKGYFESASSGVLRCPTHRSRCID